MHSKVKLILAILLLSPCLQVFFSNSTLILCYCCKDSKQYGVLGLRIGEETKQWGEGEIYKGQQLYLV